MKQVSMWSHVERKCIHFVSKCILIDGITNYHFRKYWSKNIFQTWNHHVTFCHIDVEKYHSDIFPKYQSIYISWTNHHVTDFKGSSFINYD